MYTHTPKTALVFRYNGIQRMVKFYVYRPFFAMFREVFNKEK